MLAAALFFSFLLACHTGAVAEDLTQTGFPVGEVHAQIRISQYNSSEVAGAKVWLMRFVLDDQNHPQGEMLAVVQADLQGDYHFRNLNIIKQAVFQVFAEVEGQVWKSPPVAFGSGTKLNAKVSLPAKNESPALFLMEVVMATEAQVGGIWFTEVLHWQSDYPINWQSQLIQLPSVAKHVEMLYHVESISYRLERQTLLLTGTLPVGKTLIAYRYFIPAWWGSKTIRRQFPAKVRQLSVLTPTNLLKAEGPALHSVAPRDIDGIKWNVWQRNDISASATIRVSQIPLPQQIWLLLLPLIIIPPLALGFLKRTG